MMKKIWVCLFSIVIALNQVSYVRADVLEDQSGTVTEEYDQQDELGYQGESEVSNIADIIESDQFGLFGEDIQPDEPSEPEEPRRDLTLWEHIQLAAAYIRASSLQELKQDVKSIMGAHFTANSKRYIVAASASTVIVAIALLCNSLQKTSDASDAKSTK